MLGPTEETIQDLRPWGCAPGGYFFKCIDCPSPTSMVNGPCGAKRSWRCKDHAIEASERPAAKIKSATERDDPLTIARSNLYLVQRSTAEVVQENERMRALLRKFAEAADNLDDGHRDQNSIWESPAAMSITAGMLREAKKAVS